MLGADVIVLLLGSGGVTAAIAGGVQLFGRKHDTSDKQLDLFVAGLQASLTRADTLASETRERADEVAARQDARIASLEDAHRKCQADNLTLSEAMLTMRVELAQLRRTVDGS